MMMMIFSLFLTMLLLLLFLLLLLLLFLMFLLLLFLFGLWLLATFCSWFAVVRLAVCRVLDVLYLGLWLLDYNFLLFLRRSPELTTILERATIGDTLVTTEKTDLTLFFLNLIFISQLIIKKKQNKNYLID